MASFDEIQDYIRRKGDDNTKPEWLQQLEGDDDPTPNEPDLRGRDRDEWRHEAAECQRLK